MTTKQISVRVDQELLSRLQAAGFNPSEAVNRGLELLWQQAIGQAYDELYAAPSLDELQAIEDVSAMASEMLGAIGCASGLGPIADAG
jgi:hypothetical protein